MDDFLTEYMESVSDPARHAAFDYDAERAVFIRTFTLLSRTLGEKAFSYANPARTQITRGFSVYHFEAFTLGVQSRIAAINLEDEALIERLRDEFIAIKRDANFVRITTGGGKNSPGPLTDRIDFVRTRVEALV